MVNITSAWQTALLCNVLVLKYNTSGNNAVTSNDGDWLAEGREIKARRNMVTDQMQDIKA